MAQSQLAQEPGEQWGICPSLFPSGFLLLDNITLTVIGL